MYLAFVTLSVYFALSFFFKLTTAISVTISTFTVKRKPTGISHEKQAFQRQTAATILFPDT